MTRTGTRRNLMLLMSWRMPALVVAFPQGQHPIVGAGFQLLPKVRRLGVGSE
jgi:hypothetical protein